MEQIISFQILRSRAFHSCNTVKPAVIGTSFKGRPSLIETEKYCVDIEKKQQTFESAAEVSFWQQCKESKKPETVQLERRNRKS